MHHRAALSTPRRMIVLVLLPVVVLASTLALLRTIHQPHHSTFHVAASKTTGVARITAADRRAAVRAAEQTGSVRSSLKMVGGGAYTTKTNQVGSFVHVTFLRHGRRVTTASYDPATGHVSALALSGGNRYGGAVINSAWWLLGSVLLVGLCAWRRGRSGRLAMAWIVGIAALFALAQSMFAHYDVRSAYLVGYFGLALVVIGGLVVVARGASGMQSDRWVVPDRLLWLVAGALVVVRTTLVLRTGNITDITWGSVGGARVMLDGLLPYGNLPNVGLYAHGDTYGPLTYLVYLPAAWIAGHLTPLGWLISDAGQATALLLDIATAGMLAAAAWQFGGRPASARAAVLWMAFPATTYAAANATNDALPALLLAATLACIHRPFARGVMIGLGAAAKVVPLALALPLLHVGRIGSRTRQARWVVLGIAAVGAACLAYVNWFAGGLAAFWHSVVVYQVTRADSDVSSLWAMHGLEGARAVASIVVGVGIVITSVVPRRRSAAQAAGLVVAVLALVQLVGSHWWMPYAAWWWPGVVLLAVTGMGGPAEITGEAPTTLELHEDRGTEAVHDGPVALIP